MVVAIMATLMAIGTPAIVSQITHHRLKDSARDIAVELNAARMKAVAKNTPYRVSFTLNSPVTNPDTFRLRRYNKSTASWEDAPSRHTVSMSSGIDITSPTSNFDVDFRPNGTADATTICVSNTNKTGDKMEITVTSAAGKVEVNTGC